MNSLLPFKLFCQRKKFSIEKYIKSLPESNYKDFCDFLISRSVQPPSIDFFITVKKSLKETSDSSKNKELVEKEQELKPKQHVRRKRRTKKKIDNND